MPLEEIEGQILETAHVLFIDMVSYSRLAIDEQKRLLEELQEQVRGTKDFKRASAANQLLSLPTGDGMALVFFADPEAPARCAVDLSRALRKHPEIRVRMGIHTGPVYRVSDINANLNVAGGGINIAQRVMACGDENHILVSKQAADVLGQLRHWAAALHSLGVVRVKHGLALHMFNLYAVDFGNPASPHKLRLRRVPVLLGAAVVFLIAVVLAFQTVTRPPAPKDVLVCEWGKDIGNASMSSDGSTIAFDSDATGQREIYVVPSKGGKPSLRTDGMGDKSDPRINPDGMTILYSVRAANSDIWTVPTLGGVPQKLVSDATCADWAPDGKRIVYARERTGEPASLRILDLTTQTEEEIYKSSFEQIDIVRWSPHDEWIFFGDETGPKLIKPKGGPAKDAEGLATAVDAAWSGDGKYLYYSELHVSHLVIRRVEVPAGKPEEMINQAGDSFCPMPSPLKPALIYAHGRRQGVLYAMPAGTREASELVSAGSPSDPAISPQGDRVLYIRQQEDGKEMISTVSITDQQGGPVTGEGFYYSPLWSRDAARIAYTKLTGTEPNEYWHIFIAQSESPTKPKQVTNGAFDAYVDDWSPDGKTLLFTKKEKGEVSLMSVDVSTGETSLLRQDMYGGKYSISGKWFLGLDSSDKPEGKGLWVFDSKSHEGTRAVAADVVRAVWALADRAIVYSLAQKPRGRIGLWRLELTDGKPSASPSLLSSFPATSGAENQWDVTGDLSQVVYVESRQLADLYKRTPLK
jgi:Tol biopolymer transport system component/class 3 adenylate cyclase